MERRTSPDHDANIGMLLQPAQWSVGVAINHVWANRRRKFKSQTSDDMDKWSSRGGMIQRREEKRRGEERSGAEPRGEERREEKRRNKIREEKGSEERRQKGRKFSTRSVFPMFCGSGGSKSMLAKAAGAEPSGERSAEKLHAVVGRSTLGSQHVQNTPCLEHFWKLRCEKSARCCGAKRAKSSYSYSYNHNYHYTATTTTTTTALHDATLHD